MTLAIEVLYDRVIIAGHTIMRPASISPSQWLRFWEKVKDLQ
jgi:hypothetical protein